MQKLLELWGKADKETTKLLIQWATELVSMGATKINERLKSVLRRELQHALDTEGEAK